MTGMPAFGKTQSDEQIWAIAAFLHKSRGMAAQDFQTLSGVEPAKCTRESTENPPAVEATPAPVAPALTPPLVAAPAPVAAAPSTAVFPSAISPAHVGEKPYKARRKTCSDQYQANIATNSNGDLKWIQKGGGYWSECNKHLKG
jgi:hypothetical protein